MTISFAHVVFTYPGAAKPILQDLCLEILQPSFVAIIGTNGSGKTTLAKTLTGIIPQFIQGALTGTITIDKADVTASSVAQRATKIGYVYQDFEHQLVKPRVIDDVGFSALNYGFADYAQRAQQALQRLGIMHLAHRYIWELSGGEQHLVALAGVLALDPDVLVLDEPIAQLDPMNARIVYGKLADLHRIDHKTILVIEHHSEFIAEFCTHVACIDQGSVQWYLPVAHALTRVDDLVHAQITPPISVQIVTQLISDGVIAPSSIPITIDEGVKLLKPLITTPSIACDDVQQSHTQRITTLIDVDKHISLLDGTQKSIIKQVSLSLYAGQRIALVGQNGAGKSTLLRMIAEIDTPDAGTIQHHFVDADDTATHQTFAYIHQCPQEMFVTDTVLNDISLYASTYMPAQAQTHINHLIDNFELHDLLQRDPRLLSGGQMRRVALAIGMSMQPNLLLIDEPTANLDALNRTIILRLLQNMSRHTHAVLIATHDMDLVLNWASRVIVMDAGTIIADLTPAQLFADMHLLQSTRITVPSIIALSHALALSPVPRSIEQFLHHIQKPTS